MSSDRTMTMEEALTWCSETRPCYPLEPCGECEPCQAAALIRELAEDRERLDYLERTLSFRNVVNWCVPGPQWEHVSHTGPNGERLRYETSRAAIDAARSEET